jgi:hypothetical protein
MAHFMWSVKYLSAVADSLNLSNRLNDSDSWVKYALKLYKQHVAAK